MRRVLMRWFDLRLRAFGRSRARTFEASRHPLRLDLGCGRCGRAGHVGIDLSVSAELRWNLCWGLPFSDNSVAEIRSDHFFEHLSLRAFVQLLRECHRVLIPDGILDFTVPHIDPFLDAYLADDIEFLRTKIFDVPAADNAIYSTSFDLVVWLLHRDGEHRSLFDRRSVLMKLRSAGFREVWTREFDAERDVAPPRFSSLYAVARK